MTIQVDSSGDLPCPRCSGTSYLTVQIPHPSYLYPQDRPVSAMINFRLCPRCDADNPHAHGLLAYFACHGTVRADDIDGFASLVNEWVSSLSVIPKVTPEKFEADVNAYRRGEFD